jgi:ribA/ribD-fused uncharacterized protein
MEQKLENYFKKNIQNFDRLINIKFEDDKYSVKYVAIDYYEKEAPKFSILKETSATKIKALGRSVKNYDDSIWNEHKLNIMINGLRLKFQQNKKLLEELLSTNNKILYEASKNDKIWGIGFYTDKAITVNPNKYGQNLLGEALMIIRNELKNN